MTPPNGKESNGRSPDESPRRFDEVSGAGAVHTPQRRSPRAGAKLAGSEPRPMSIQMPGEKTFAERYLNKGNISNLITFVIMIIGIAGFESNRCSTAWAFVMSFGLFGFAGGFTNWLAIKMLFDQIPFLVGSGVIPRRFKEIRETVKNTIMNTFFDEAYLQAYIRDRSKGLLESFDLGAKLTAMLDKPEMDTLLLTKLEEAGETPTGAMLKMASGMMGGYAGMVPMIKPMLAGFADEIVPLLAKTFDAGDLVKIETVRAEIDRLMTEKLKLLTPAIVKRLMEEVIREHLGWLIVWGNVFGGLIGIFSQLAGLGTSVDEVGCAAAAAGSS